jgi:hypothetical protein
MIVKMREQPRRLRGHQRVRALAQAAADRRFQRRRIDVFIQRREGRQRARALRLRRVRREPRRLGGEQLVDGAARRAAPREDRDAHGSQRGRCRDQHGAPGL